MSPNGMLRPLLYAEMWRAQNRRPHAYAFSR
jgi:hypothetical protein